ncbi:hypothetical protein, partial [Aquamicrobium sp.]|uniref:hypothetical protein n=1 Tax=Aquamicrobium sp. TaxID=1872579 RepID=UPI002590A24A
MKIKTLLLTACTAALAFSPLSGLFAEPAEVAPNMFGGASYQGEPALAVTSALVKAGGGADDFSFAKALVNMLGQDTVEAEIAKLNKQYGEEDVQTFIEGMDLAIAYSLKRA